MSHVKIMAREHIDRALVIRTSMGLQNVVPGTPLELPLADLEAVGKQCAETDYDVKVVGGVSKPEAKSDSESKGDVKDDSPAKESKVKGAFKSMKKKS